MENNLWRRTALQFFKVNEICRMSSKEMEQPGKFAWFRSKLKILTLGFHVVEKTRDACRTGASSNMANQNEVLHFKITFGGLRKNCRSILQNTAGLVEVKKFSDQDLAPHRISTQFVMLQSLEAFLFSLLVKFV